MEASAPSAAITAAPRLGLSARAITPSMAVIMPRAATATRARSSVTPRRAARTMRRAVCAAVRGWGTKGSM